MNVLEIPNLSDDVLILIREIAKQSEMNSPLTKLMVGIEPSKPTATQVEYLLLTRRQK